MNFFTKKAFTLVELMIVIAIIGILAAALFPSMTGYIQRSRDTARLAQVQYIISANELFKTDIGRYADRGSGELGCWGWDTPIDNVFIPELANYSRFRDPDKSSALSTPSAQCGWIGYYRYGVGDGSCPMEKGRFYILWIQRVNNGVTWDNPGFSCSGGGTWSNLAFPGLAPAIVFGSFEN